MLRLLVWSYWSIFMFHFVSPGGSVCIQDHWKKTSNWTFGCVSWCLNKPSKEAEMLVISKGKQTHFNEVTMMEEIVHCKAIPMCAGLMTTVLSWLFCTVHEFLVSNNDSKSYVFASIKWQGSPACFYFSQISWQLRTQRQRQTIWLLKRSNSLQADTFEDYSH